LTQWSNPVASQGEASLGPLLQGTSEYKKYFPFTGEVSDCAISPDGTQVAFTTTRQRFGASPFTLATEIPAAVSLVSELYVLDLGSNTAERVTPGLGKVVSEASAQGGGAVSPSLDEDGRAIAFASGAKNLVAGDANEGEDIFTIEALPQAPVGTSAISAKPVQPTVHPSWRISANAYSRPDGTVRVIARVPGAGTLRALARAQVGARLKTKQVAHGKRRAGGARSVTLDLKLGRGRRRLTHLPGGLVTRLRVSFTGPGGQPLHATLQSRFLVHRKHLKNQRKAAR
jgi:hypothetical protein